MRLSHGYCITFCGIVLAICCTNASPSVVINRCCAPDQIYDAVKDKCKPWPGAGGNTDTNISSGNATDLDGNSYGPVSVNTLNLSREFVKILNVENDSSQMESFVLQDHFPTSACSSGSFLQSFCTSENETSCANGAQRLLITTRGELRVGEELYDKRGRLTSREYFSSLEYCVTRVQDNSIDFRICNPTCTEAVPCVQKCCDVDQIVNRNHSVGFRCELADSVAWQPYFYSSVKISLKNEPYSPVRPHYFITHPRAWCTDSKRAFIFEQRDEASRKLSWLFRIGMKRNVFRRNTRFRWSEYVDRWNYSCVDGVINSSYVPEGATDIFEGLEEEDMLLECLPPKEGQPSTMRSKSQLGIYAAAKIISCLFLLATLVVHFLLWKRQNVHGWTLMSYCFTLFFTYFLYVCKYFHSFWATRNVQADPLCVFIGTAITFFFISTFCWMTMINFDLWWTLRKFKASTGAKSVKRYIAYATVSLVTPTIFVAVATALDFAYGDEPESGVIVPEYGKIECGPEPEYALWTYQNGPAGIFLLFNLFFFASTLYGIYRTQEDAKFATSSSSGQVDAKDRAKLFGKLLIIMGIPFVFEFISGLAERGSYGDVAWYWAIFDMINFFQGVFIFFIFVFKDEMRRELAKKYAAFTWFAPGTSTPSGSTTSKQTNSSGVSGNTSGSQETGT